MERNVELLEQTLQFCKDHPERHDQGSWICGTTACYAGNALLLWGMTPEELSSHAERYIDLWDGSPGFCNEVHREAAELLGLTVGESRWLFRDTNTLPMLELMVKDLVNGDEIHPTSHYRKETS